MKKTFTLVLLLAGSHLLRAEDNAGKTFSDGTLPEALRQYDVNGDGALDEEERQAAKADREARLTAARLNRWDTNGDGVIDDAERAAAKEALRERILAARKARFAKIAGEDGLMSLEEFASIPALKGRTREQIAAIFGHLDANKDGSVSLAEFLGRLDRPQLPPISNS
ncbi:EF-hand domain-containing protein [Akkermansiaceae bacterium]|nr:EF-hand domain-containing protein [Akkermansiaceae bacterium]